MAHEVYAGSFIVGEPTIIVYYDHDHDGDLEGFASATLTYTPKGQAPIDWGTVPVAPLSAKFIDPDGNDTLKVCALLITITPKGPLLGCLGKLLTLARGLRRPDSAIGGTGTVGGSLNKGGAATPIKGKVFSLDINLHDGGLA